MKKYTVTLLLIFNALFILAQIPHFSCGTSSSKSKWLQDYQKDPQRYLSSLQNRGGVTYLPLTLTIVGSDDSLGMVPVEGVLSSFCQLNRDFEGTGLQFFIEGNIRYIYESAFYIHDSVKAGGIRMLQYNIPNTLNVYFVASPAGNCGYNLPYAGIAMNNNCIDGHTFAHEMGHCLNLPHTFLGWEGGISYNGSPVSVFNSPAPERVTINYTDFKDTLYLNDTLIVDTVFVERVPRSGSQSNCNTAADGFCDTPSDYLAFRWYCTSTNSISATRQLDPDSVAFFSDGWYIMSYAYDECQGGFSNEQVNAMNAFVVNEKPNWLYNQNPIRDSVGAAQLIYPAPSQIIPATNPRFTWQSTSGATHYLIEVYKEPYATNQIVEKHITSDTFFQSSRYFPPRPAIFPYGWRVRPFNQSVTCVPFSSTQFFNTIIPSGMEITETEPNLEIDIMPSFVSKSQQLNLLFKTNIELLKLDFYNVAGQRIFSTENLVEGNNALQISLPDAMVAGMYFIHMRDEKGRSNTQKIVVHN